MNRDAFELGFTLDEFTTEVNRGSKVQFINHQTEPLWRTGHTPDQARTELLKTRTTPTVSGLLGDMTGWLRWNCIDGRLDDRRGMGRLTGVRWMVDRTEETRFYLAEIVDWLDPGRFHPEVTIIGPRHWTGWTDRETGQRGVDWCYSVQYADGGQGIEVETNLRRKRIPPNPDAVSAPKELECV